MFKWIDCGPNFGDDNDEFQTINVKSESDYEYY